MLTCEKSSFGHNKSRHRKFVKMLYHDYSSSQAVPGPLGRAVSLGGGAGGGASLPKRRLRLLAGLNDYNSQDVPDVGYSLRFRVFCLDFVGLTLCLPHSHSSVLE